MRRTLLLTLGGAIGYVLGARAGRPAYDRIVEGWSSAVSAAGLGRLATSVTDAGVDIRDSAVDRASQAVSTTADDMAERIASDVPASHGQGSSVGSMDPDRAY